jgi:hypothetical protein
MFTFIRQCVQSVGNTTGLFRLPIFNRFVFDDAKLDTEINNKRDISLKINNNANVKDEIKRSKGILRTIFDGLKGNDSNSFNFIFVRSVQETQGVTDTTNKISNYIRGLFVEAGSLAETDRRGDYYRTQIDVIQTEGLSLRHLLIFVKLLSACFVRDFVIRRFLVAREELVLKSCITRDLLLESKIN